MFGRPLGVCDTPQAGPLALWVNYRQGGVIRFAAMGHRNDLTFLHGDGWPKEENGLIFTSSPPPSQVPSEQVLTSLLAPDGQSSSMVARLKEAVETVEMSRAPASLSLCRL